MFSMYRKGNNYRLPFTPVWGETPGPGTNGYTTSWGPNLSSFSSQFVAI